MEGYTHYTIPAWGGEYEWRTVWHSLKLTAVCLYIDIGPLYVQLGSDCSWLPLHIYKKKNMRLQIKT